MSVVDGVRVAIAPPPDYHVDFDNPARRSVNETYIISSLGMALAAFFVYQRLYVKHYLRHNLGYDDLLLVIAWLGSIAIQALIIYSIHHVIMGVHAWEIPYDKFRQFAIIGGYTTSIIYVVPTALSKIVILLFYRELESHHTWYRHCIHGAMFIVATSNIAVLLVSIFPCQPLAMSWNLDLANGPGHCIDRKALYEATAAFGVAVDLIIIALPVPLVIAMRVSAVQRMGILLLFTLGSATIITSIVRLALLISNLDALDQTWGGGPVCMWVTVEANMLIMAASQFTLPHFVKSVAAQFTSRKPKPKPKGKEVASSNHEMRTFGATSSKHYYSRFDETDIGTDTVVNVQGLPPVDYDQDDDCESQRSNRPIRGIMQTKETVIRYEMTLHT